MVADDWPAYRGSVANETSLWLRLGLGFWLGFWLGLGLGLWLGLWLGLGFWLGFWLGLGLGFRWGRFDNLNCEVMRICISVKISCDVRNRMLTGLCQRALDYAFLRVEAQAFG